MGTVAYNSIGTTLRINDVKVDQVLTVAVDFSTGRIRGLALASTAESHTMMQTLRAGDRVKLELRTARGLEYQGNPRVLMVRLRTRVSNLLRLSFVFVE